MSPDPEPATRRPSKVTVRTLQKRREAGRPISMVTAYDYPTARLAERAGIDVLLVGDSLAMVVLGHETTLAVTMDEMIHHARAVRRGATRPLLVGDLPFMSYQAEVAEAVRNAGRFLQQAAMDAVKLEGGRAVADRVRAIADAGIPVMGHLGLTPQSVHALGGWRVQGRTATAARELLEDARALEEAGCFALVLECVPDRLAELVTGRLTIPTLGIGAGGGVSGQVLVLHDLLGLFDRLAPRFVKRYAELGDVAVEALEAFRREVEAGSFPAPEHGYRMPAKAWQRLLAELDPAPPELPARASGGPASRRGNGRAQAGGGELPLTAAAIPGAQR